MIPKFRAYETGYGEDDEFFVVICPENHNMWLFHEIDLEKVEMSTGLKDKNGKEIFEGDIIEFDFVGKVRLVVKWAKDIPMLIGDGEFEKILHENSARKVMEVIGNIHENPELLK